MGASGAERDALADGPDEPEQLAGDGGGRDGLALAVAGAVAVAMMQADLGVPRAGGDVGS